MSSILILAAAGLSSALAYASYYFGTTTLVETIISGLLGTIVLEIAILVWKMDGISLSNISSLKYLQEVLSKENLAKEHKNQFDNMERHLLEIRSSSHGSKDLFVSHLIAEIKALEARLHDAAKKKELRIRSDYILNVEGVFDSLSVSNERKVRLTYPVDSGESWIGGHSDKRFFEVLLDQVKSRKVQDLELLFLTDDLTSEEQITIERVCGWLNSQQLIKAKIGKQTDFKRILQLNSLNNSFLDYGVYGPEMLFRTTSEGVEHEGIYTKDPEVVRRYDAVFEEFWDSSAFCEMLTLEKNEAKSLTANDILRIEPAQVLLLEDRDD